MTPETRGRIIRTWHTQDGVKHAIVGLDGRGDRINAVVPRGVDADEGANIVVVERGGQYVVGR